MIELIFHFQGKKISCRLAEGQSVILGRQQNGKNSIAIPDLGVSDTHASISLMRGKIKICDLDSTNGTFVDGVRVSPGSVVTISREFKLGPVAVEIRTPSSKQSPNSEKSGSSLDALLASKSEVIIGRMTDCDIVLNESTVSKRHARVLKKDGVVYVEDLGSTNGTFKNRHRIKGKTALGTNDIISIGLTTFQLGHETKKYSGFSAISISGVGKVLPNGKVVLQPVSLDIPSGSFTALMGPSGCGKSTLLKTINGASPASSGLVKIFGRELCENYEELKQHIGYVPQNDYLYNELTVERTLYYAAKLRLQPNLAEEKIIEQIDNVLNVLKIEPKDRNTPLGELSGGQRKRISIAVELLSNPSILLLDEPTSPLDPETISEFLDCLKSLCENGTTVIMVTHKPEDLKFADNVVFLGSKGRHVYYGPANEFKAYFKQTDILEIYKLLSQNELSNLWYNKWKINQPLTIPTPPQKIKQHSKVDFFHQLYWLTVRYFRVKIGDEQNMKLLFLQPLIIGGLLIFVYSDIVKEVVEATLPSSLELPKSLKSGNPAVIFLMAIAAIWFGMSNSAKEIVGETSIFYRERMYNLKIRTYLISKWIILMLISFIQLILFLALLKLSYKSDLVAIPETLLFLIFLSSGSILFGLCLSAFSKTVNVAMSYLPIVLMPQIILSGVLSNLNNKGIEILSYLTFGRWGTEGIARIQDGSMNEPIYLIESNNPALCQNLYNCLYGNPNLLSLFQGLEENIIAIVILSIIFLALTIIKLMNFDRRFYQAQIRKQP
jgi:ABC-type multidrug transport system ATPase subunit